MEQDHQELAYSLTRLENIMKVNQGISDEDLIFNSFLTFKINTQTEKTVASVQKFYFNSSLTALKTLWLLKTMNETEKARKRIPEKLLKFIKDINGIVEFIRIKRERQVFSLMANDKDEYQMKLIEMINLMKKISSFKLFEFLRSYNYRIQNAKHVRGAFYIQTFVTRKITAYFSKLRTYKLAFKNEGAYSIFHKGSLLLYAQQKKLSSILKTLRNHNLHEKRKQGLFLKTDAIIHRKNDKLIRDGFLLILIRSQLKNKSKTYMNVIFTIALRKLNELVSNNNDRKKRVLLTKYMKGYINKRDKVRRIFLLLSRSTKLKAGRCLNSLKYLVYSKNAKRSYFLSSVLKRTLKKDLKSGFDRIKYESEIAMYKVHYNHLWKKKISQLVAQTSDFKDKAEAEIFQVKLKHNMSFLEKFIREKNLKMLLIVFSKLRNTQKRRTIFLRKPDNNKIIKNTIVLTNMYKHMTKKLLLMQFKAFQIWKNAKDMLKHKKSLGGYTDGNSDLNIRQREFNETKLAMLEYTLNKLLQGRLAVGFYRIKFINKLDSLIAVKVLLYVIFNITQKEKLRSFRRVRDCNISKHLKNTKKEVKRYNRHVY